MAWVGTAIGVGGAVVSGVTGSIAAGQAADEQRQASKEQEIALNLAYRDVSAYADEYTEFLTKLDLDFDPLDVEDAFNNLYESVIQPMERDFDENVLPGIQAAYSGGIMGQGAGLSGAAASAEATARRGLSETKAGLRAEERGSAIQRNFAEYDRRAQLGEKKFQTQTAAPLMRAGQAQQIYGAKTDSIAATLASRQQVGSAIAGVGSMALSGASLY
jgi:hypothetical protein